MPKPFHQLSLAQFRQQVESFHWTRQINAVHMHHTWSPSHSDYQGENTINAMWNYHTKTKGWSDIAQHVSVGPGGEIWTGRGWNNPPASSTGHNGSTGAGPFMFEIIGNFDEDEDVFEGTQKQAVIGIVVTLLDHFNLPVSALKFHRQLGSPKSCPGDTIDYQKFCAEVEAARAATAANGAKKTAKNRSVAMPPASAEVKKALEDVIAHVAEESGACPSCGDAPGGGERGLFGKKRWTPAEKEVLARHVINLRDGRFIESGGYVTRPEEVRHLFETLLPEEVEVARRAGRPLRVLLWAHGGLVPEEDALQHVLDYSRQWRSAGIYPIYFIWETGLMTALGDLFTGTPRAGEREWTDAGDKLLEMTLHYPGLKVWGQMKEYALHASAAEGGARYTAELIARFAEESGEAAEFHACGHSAGSIFHSHFLPCLYESGGPRVRNLFLLAPAITVDAFAERLTPLLGVEGGVGRVAMFTMNDPAERADNCIKIYRKSLLYFVSRACEPEQPTPILGMEIAVRDDARMRRVFGLDGSASPIGEIVWSPNKIHGGPSASNSRTHGGFDNDIDTLNSLARRMTGDNALAPFGVPESDSRSVSAGAGGRRLALCIGIDDYTEAPLYGCVNDAKQWRSTLQSLGYEVTLLTNEAATRAGMIDAIGRLIRGGRPGDSLVLQYAGHGTFVDDVSGDEAELMAGDTQDEALVPHDYTTGEFLIDDDLGALFDELPEGARLTCFMDCCHSGTNVRGVLPILTPSGKRPGERERFIVVRREIMQKHVAFRRKLGGAVSRDTLRAVRPEVSFAACLDKQTAKELDGHGHFTVAACGLLAASAGHLTHAAFIEAVIRAFPLPAESQMPYLFCSTERRDEILLAATEAPRTAAGTEGDQATPAPDSASSAKPGGIHPQDLIETMRDYMQILKRLV